MSYYSTFTKSELEVLTLPELSILKKKLEKQNKICNYTFLLMLKRYESGIENKEPILYLYHIRDIIQNMSRRGLTREFNFKLLQKEMENREVDVIG